MRAGAAHGEGVARARHPDTDRAGREPHVDVPVGCADPRLDPRPELLQPHAPPPHERAPAGAIALFEARLEGARQPSLSTFDHARRHSILVPRCG
jgi:hypothetical protein